MRIVLLENIDFPDITPYICKDQTVHPEALIHQGCKVKVVFAHESFNLSDLKRSYSVFRIYSEHQHDPRPSGIHWSMNHKDFKPLRKYLSEIYPEYFI